METSIPITVEILILILIMFLLRLFTCVLGHDWKLCRCGVVACTKCLKEKPGQ